MITCRLKGGLGNMMFQIAATEWMAKQDGLEVFYYNADQHLAKLNNEVKHNPSMKHAEKYKKIFANFHWPTEGKFTKTIKLPFHYVPIKVEDGVCYDGFFQCERYFNSGFTDHIFYPTYEIIRRIQKYDLEGNTCSIHVRRGDFVKLDHIHPTQHIEYFNRAMGIIKADKYLVFSDDIEWCKKNFIGDQFTFIEDIDYVEMFLQSYCKHNIISNSSFSWWGAYLNWNPDKIIVAPKKWFGNSKYNSKDIIPKSWKTI